jgi:NADPH:quinone reductase-like Zn-dependent oxidoreductase
MRAVLLTGYGGLDQLELRNDVPEPVAGPGELKVRVAATSVNPVDWKIRSGANRQRSNLKFPAVLGRDASGEVVAVGDGIGNFRVGDKVLGLVEHAYAEYVVAAQGAWAPLPASMNIVDAAALPLVTLTGSQLVDEAVQPRPGDVVLVTGALGSVGRAAVFAARSRGAEVLAGVRGTQKDEAAKLNVDVVALDDDAALARLGRLDSIADTIDGETLQKLLDKVKQGGTVGSVLGEPRGAKERGLIARAFVNHPDSERLAALAQAVANGELVIPIVARLPLEQVREAQAMSEKGVGGKIVLRLH